MSDAIFGMPDLQSLVFAHFWRNVNSSEGLRRELDLPPISQIGVAVKDVDQAVEYYSSVFGIGPFTVYDFTPEKHWYLEEPSPLTLRQGKAMWGTVEWELMQLLDGRSAINDFLETHGEGLQHFGFVVPDYDEKLCRMERAGFRPLARIESHSEIYGGYLKACLFDTRRTGGVMFEFIWKSWRPECQ
jgi:catechol 2,3-dioxygenase-like lactoylglutathione lyase family enzyme